MRASLKDLLGRIVGGNAFTLDPRLVVSKPLPPTEGNLWFTWTLASRLGEMLRVAEERFGPRDKSYTPLGVEFTETGPQVWYPGNCGNIVIQLSLGCLNDLPRACYQLAHECIHLLSPSGQAGVNVLEEGMAMLFSQDYVAEHFPEVRLYHPSAPPDSYREAMRQTEELLSFSPGLVKQVRVREPMIRNITAEMICEHCPAVPEELARAVTRPFRRPSP